MYEKLCNIKWLERCGSNPSKIQGKKTKFKGGLEGNGERLHFCKYQTAKYTHIYQYWDIRKDTKIVDLIDYIIKQLIKAKTIIDSGQLSF